MAVANGDLSTSNHHAPAPPKILLVDDNASIRSSLGQVLKHNGFEVVAAANVNEALKHIGSARFDVLVSDLHMPDAGDGLTVVSAMRHSNPEAVTLIFSAYPEMDRAAAAIVQQADKILVKPLEVEALVDIIRERLKLGPVAPPTVETVADILEQETETTIREWLARADQEPELTRIPISAKDRTAHLPEMFRNLVSRLRNPLPLGTRALVSEAAARHGLLRREQGYSAAMMVEESRMLQVCIFQTLQNNLNKVDFSILLVGVMAIADEVDSQLAQAMASFVFESKTDSLPVIV